MEKGAEVKQRNNSLAALFSAALVLAGVTGCGDSLGRVTGKVTYEGTPIAEGQVVFEPTADGKGNIAAGMIKDGVYTATEVPPGKKIVNITGIGQVKFASSSEEMMKQAEEMKIRGDDSGLVAPADQVPPNAVGNRAEVEIKAGSQEMNFDLKKPAGRPAR
jgi:hypothetical protein